MDGVLAGFVQGLGTGFLFAPLNTLGYATLDPSHRTEGTIVGTMARTLGSSLGISVVQAFLTHQTVEARSGLTDNIAIGDPTITAALPAAASPATSDGIQVLNIEVSRQAAMIGYDNVFSFMAIGVVLLLPLLLMMKPAAPVRTDLESAVE